MFKLLKEFITSGIEAHYAQTEASKLNLVVLKKIAIRTEIDIESATLFKHRNNYEIFLERRNLLDEIAGLEEKKRPTKEDRERLAHCKESLQFLEDVKS